MVLIHCTRHVQPRSQACYHGEEKEGRGGGGGGGGEIGIAEGLLRSQGCVVWLWIGICGFSSLLGVVIHSPSSTPSCLLLARLQWNHAIVQMCFCT